MIEAFILICLFGAIGLVVMEYRLGATQAGTGSGPRSQRR
jgi:hypothetical protein